MKKTLIAALAAGLLIVLPATAQNPRIDIKHLDKPNNKATRHVEISLSGSDLKMAIEKKDSKLREALKDVNGIFVRVLSLGEKDSISNEDIEAIKRQIKPPWKPLLLLKGNNNQNANIHVLVDSKTETLRGLVVLFADAHEFTFVNIVGNIEPNKLYLLGGNFGVPKMSFNEKNKDE